jgi:quercetin dioxygenase-like cupin family protein
MYLAGRPSAPIGPPRQDSRGAVRHDLVRRDLCGCADGEVALLEIEPGSTYEVTQAGESGSILLDGTAHLLAPGRVETLSPGAIVHAPAGAPLSIRAADRQVTLLVVCALTGTAGRPDRPLARDAPATSPRIRVSTVDAIMATPVHAPERGFFHMKARSLIDADNGGSTALLLGQGTFAPGGGCHALHRHPHACEIFYVWSGEGVHLADDGSELPVRVGDLVYIPRNEWHGFRNTGHTEVQALFGYIGVNSREAAGYELPPPGRMRRPPGTTNDTESMSSFSASQTVRGANDERPETR